MSQKSSVWPTTPPQNILVRMPNWLGDLVMATPVLANLRDHFKQAKITAMCLSQSAPLLEKNPYIDEVFSFVRPSGWIHRTWSPKSILTPLRQGNYDLGVLLTHSFSSAWWFWRGQVRNRIGFAAHYRSWLLNQAVALPAT